MWAYIVPFSRLDAIIFFTAIDATPFLPRPRSWISLPGAIAIVCVAMLDGEKIRDSRLEIR